MLLRLRLSFTAQCMTLRKKRMMKMNIFLVYLLQIESHGNGFNQRGENFS